jgi:hypothetical protein
MPRTRHTVSAQLLADLNDEITLAPLPRLRAETCFINGWVEPEADTALVRPKVPPPAVCGDKERGLRGEVRRLGTPVRVIPLSA